MTRRKSSSPKRSKHSTGRTLIYNFQGKRRKILKSTVRTISKLQASTKLCIPRSPILRLIKELLLINATNNQLRVQLQALNALQEAAEMYLTQLFEDSNMCAAHSKRITLKPVDMNLVLALKEY